jgi:adhesin transport system membrane fusion protein
VRTPSDQLQSLGRALPVRPGMQGDAEIRTGQRTVMSFLLRRILRVQEAFTER